jgi:hypothetical protein
MPVCWAETTLAQCRADWRGFVRWRALVTHLAGILFKTQLLVTYVM